MIVVVGFSHRDAPIEVRERLAVDRDHLPDLLRRAVEGTRVSEALCVSTCNRMELYAATGASDPAVLEAAAAELRGVLGEVARANGSPEAVASVRARTGSDALHHLFRVASSLDSLVVGEPQILGQVKTALEVARETGTVGRYLERAVSRALHVAKRVRTETAIAEGQVSVSSVAVDLAAQIFGDLAGRTTLLIGAGEMAEAAARVLVKAGASLVVVNRSPERGVALAAETGGTFRPWDELAACLAEADVILTSTSARGYVVTRPMVEKAMRARRGRSLFFVDIAVPRDVEPAVNDVDGVYVYDVDDLSQIVAESLRERQAEAASAERLIEGEAREFAAWAERLHLTPTIVALREKVRAALAIEAERSLAGKLKHLGAADRAALDVMLDAATNRLLHTPVTRLKAAAGEPRGDELAESMAHLFDLPIARDDAQPESDHGATPEAATPDPSESENLPT